MSRIFALFLLSTLLLAACRPGPAVTQPAATLVPQPTALPQDLPPTGPYVPPTPVNLNPPQAALEQPFSLSVGAQTSLADQALTVEFRQVLSDSRCPMNARCVTAGEATVLLFVQPAGMDPRSMLLTTRPDQTIGIAGGYQVELLDLLPFPQDTAGIDPQAYSVTLQVGPVSQPGQARLGQPFQLGLFQQANLEDAGLHLRMEQPPADSRCPSQVDCVVGGEARVRLIAWQGDGPQQTLDLSTMPDQRSVDLAGYRLRLLSVDPYPEFPDQPIPANKYFVTLLVEPQ